eukprot:5907526-Pleurochrysis_carterae.AAC.1
MPSWEHVQDGARICTTKCRICATKCRKYNEVQYLANRAQHAPPSSRYRIYLERARAEEYTVSACACVCDAHASL